MAVYAIRCGTAGPVKLGKADSPKQRLAELQVAHWEKLHLIRVWEGGEVEEKMLHVMFDDLHIRGDWFSFTRAMLGDVGLPDIMEPPPIATAPVELVAMGLPLRQAEFGALVKKQRQAMGLTQERAAARLATSRSTLASIEAGHDLPGRALLFRIAELFSIDLGGLEAAA